MRPYGSPETLQRRREGALALCSKGYQPIDIARMLGVDRRSVRRWKSAYRAKGEQGIKAKPAPGRPCRLSAKDKRALERELLKGARAAGFPVDLWTCPPIAELINARFGVSYHVDHVCRLLGFLGWSPPKARTSDDRARRDRDQAMDQGGVAPD